MCPPCTKDSLKKKWINSKRGEGEISTESQKVQNSNYGLFEMRVGGMEEAGFSGFSQM